MYLEQSQQAMPQLYLSDQQFDVLLSVPYIRVLTVVCVANSQEHKKDTQGSVINYRGFDKL